MENRAAGIVAAVAVVLVSCGAAMKYGGAVGMMTAGALVLLDLLVGRLIDRKAEK